MTLQASGAISIDNLATEFGGAAPHGLLSYHRGGTYVPNTTTNNNIPTSGALGLTSFYNSSSTITGAVSGGGTVSNTTGSGAFSLSASTNFNSPSYSWSTTAGSLSSTTAASTTLTLTAAASTNVSATVTCVMSSSGKSTTHTASCTYDNTATSETVSIAGGGVVTGSASTGTTGTFNLTASGTPTTPSSYSWSTTAGTLSATTGSAVTLTIFVSQDGSQTATVTCVMNVSGTNYTATTNCSVNNVYCFSGCTRILTSEGYRRFDELPPVFIVVNHTGKHPAKLLVHENSLEPMRRMGPHLVTERHLIKVGDTWLPASELFHEKVPIEPRTVYNAHVLTENSEDHHYLLENGLTAHNVKA